MFCQQNAINIYYSDTDKPLPNYLCGDELGKMKGKKIIRALFLSKKFYVYQYIKDNIIETESGYKERYEMNV